MMNAKFFQIFSQQFSAFSQSASQQGLGRNLKQHFSSWLLRTFQDLNLVTQEEFDIQTKELARAKQKLAELESQLLHIESKLLGQKDNGSV